MLLKATWGGKAHQYVTSALEIFPQEMVHIADTRAVSEWLQWAFQ